MLRLGLCCKFHEEPIRFRVATAAALARLGRAEALRKLSGLCLANAGALEQALRYCAGHGIGAFRVNSQILPLKTHPTAGYDVRDLPAAREIVEKFRQCGQLGRELGLRTLFHPDQFIVLSSPDAGVVQRSIAELEYQAEVADWIGADVINLHAGGAYGDKPAALRRLAAVLRRLPAGVRRRLTLENDERVYSPADLLPFCEAQGVPMVYDVHHHRCLPDGLGEEPVTQRAIATWDREPVLHISSPREGWQGARPAWHSDYLDPRGFPACWLGLDATVEVEAKAKELAVLKLRRYLARKGACLSRKGGCCARSDLL